jgi:hypothetical protein
MVDPNSAGAPAKRRGCLSWPVLIVGGCLTLVVGAVLVVGLIVGLLQMALRSNDAYSASLAAARASAAVREDFGEPLTPGWWVSGSASVEKDNAAADLQYRIAGPKAEGVVFVQGTKTGGVWTYSVMLVRRDDGKSYPLQEGMNGTGTDTVEATGARTAEKVIAQPIPEFLKSAGTPSERSPTAMLSPPPTPVRLAPVEAVAVQTETAFMSALLSNKPEQALAVASNSFLLEGGIEVLKSFGELAQERGGGTFTPQKTAQLEEGNSAVVGEVVFGDGTKMKVTVLTRVGKVEGFTSAR